MVHQPRLVLLGKQGAGKGTQARRLADHYEVVHLSTGELFRAQAEAGTLKGLEAKSYMDEGKLVPDDVVVAVVEECLRPGAPLAEGFVLDGFPRTLAQAEELDRIIGDHPLDVVIDLDVPTEVVMDRLAGRRVCKDCQRVYHVNMPPTKPWVCDTCGGEVVQRDDDTPAAIAIRLDIYEQETVPIIEYYRERGQLVVVDGVGTGDDVFDRLVRVVDEQLKSPAA
ncbi:MAG TPA: adenylate kinase [Acidimicrobiia bacterium]|nr:adenylate kinase [Acidimicrobiia bacterium]